MGRSPPRSAERAAGSARLLRLSCAPPESSQVSRGRVLFWAGNRATELRAHSAFADRSAERREADKNQGQRFGATASERACAICACSLTSRMEVSLSLPEPQRARFLLPPAASRRPFSPARPSSRWRPSAGLAPLRVARCPLPSWREVGRGSREERSAPAKNSAPFAATAAEAAANVDGLQAQIKGLVYHAIAVA